MSLWKQIAGVTVSLCIGGSVGALVAALFTQPLDYAPLTAVGAAIVTIPCSLIFGLPGFFLLRRLGILNFVSVSLVGILASTLVMSGQLFWGFQLIGLIASAVALLVTGFLGIPRRLSRTRSKRSCSYRPRGTTKGPK